ncbi:MAG: pyridoxamine 5'-phosphate oxidase family protein [Acidobacteria bacterium]|nr:pyridoxamine 5'-phosphate oxidase family protein [Acidobacteriota bacterium]MDA1235568.1 pyridoxamine 5'-phosphate oxidase family protein [Acidobacteriota bacterium]
MAISDIAFSGAVKAAQEKHGSRRSYAKMEARGGWADAVTQSLRDFIAARDSFYLGTANAAGQPYIQHRGGPRGFLKVLDDHLLGFADYAGNSQYISLGNLSENNKAFICLMDYTTQTRIKLWGEAEFVEDDPQLLKRLIDEGYEARPQRAFVFRLKAWDVNCNQHIRQRFAEDEADPGVRALEARVAELEAQLRSAGLEPNEEVSLETAK